MVPRIFSDCFLLFLLSLSSFTTVFAQTFYHVGSGQQYSTISAAISALPSDLAGKGEQRIVIHRKSGNAPWIYNESIRLENEEHSNASANDFIRIIVAEEDRHTGIEGSGVLLYKSTGSLVQIGIPYTKIDGLEIKGGNGDAMVECHRTAVKIRNCLIHDNEVIENGGAGVEMTGTNDTLINSIIYNIKGHGVIATLSQAIAVVQNVTVYNADDCGIDVHNGATMDVQNCISMDCGVKDFRKVSATWRNFSNNMSSDNTAPGSNSIQNAQSADQFVSLDPDNFDFHIKQTSHALNSGIDLSGSFTKDIDGQSRPLESIWDIGADEGSKGNLEISGFQVKSNNVYEIDTLQTGKKLYVDEGYTFTDIWDYEGNLYIKTANADANIEDEDFLKFSVNARVTVVITFDSVGETFPVWLNNWWDVDVPFTTTNGERKVFAKNFEPGIIKLGGNKPPDIAAGSMYNVIIVYSRDSDNDKVPDDIEISLGFDPNDPSKVPVVHNINPDQLSNPMIFSSDGSNLVDTFGINGLREAAYELSQSLGAENALPHWDDYMTVLNEIAQSSDDINGMPLIVANIKFVTMDPAMGALDKRFFMASFYRDPIVSKEISIFSPVGMEFSQFDDNIIQVTLEIEGNTIILDDPDDIAEYEFTSDGEKTITVTVDYDSGFQGTNKFKAKVEKMLTGNFYNE